MRAGFAAAAEHPSSLIVETYLTGDDHRLLVVNGEARRGDQAHAGHVVGDGRSTVRELVDIVNQGPRRGVGHEKVMTRLALDAQADMMLARQSLTPDSVPAAGQVVPLRSTANLSTGGTATDVTDVIHPDNRDMAVRAITAIGLDVGGVDFLTPDITESYRSVGGGICGKCNAAPGFHARRAQRGHAARRGRTGDRHAVPAGHAEPGADRLHHRHQRQDDDLAHARAHHQDGRLHAGADDDRRRLHRRPAHGGGDSDRAGVDAHGAGRPQIDIAVLEVARGGCCAPAWACPKVNVGAVLNVQADHLA